LSGGEEGLLARRAPEIASLFEPSLERAQRILELKLLADNVILNDLMGPRLRAIFDDFVNALIRELEGRASSIRAYAFRVIVAQNTTN
jgi:hypothetical protein